MKNELEKLLRWISAKGHLVSTRSGQLYSVNGEHYKKSEFNKLVDLFRKEMNRRDKFKISLEMHLKDYVDLNDFSSRVKASLRYTNYLNDISLGAFIKIKKDHLIQIEHLSLGAINEIKDSLKIHGLEGNCEW